MKFQMKQRILIAAPLVLMAAAAVASDPVAKPDKVVICAACHGENGKSTQSIYPNLAGQYENYIVHSLEAYKSGARKNAIMNGQAAGLSDEDIAQLAKWFSQQEPAIYTPSPYGEKK